jgi:hypothetical protein
MTTYLAISGGLTALAAKRGRLARPLSAGDLILYGVATHKLSRMVAKDVVTSPLREPFTETTGHTAPAEVGSKPQGTGLRRAVGELVSCPFCLSQWIATAALLGHVTDPGVTRFIASTLTVHALADALQFAYVGLQRTEEA